MPGYITKQLQKYQHEISPRPLHSLYPSAPNKYRTSTQEPFQSNESNPDGPEGITRILKYS